MENLVPLVVGVATAGGGHHVHTGGTDGLFLGTWLASFAKAVAIAGKAVEANYQWSTFANPPDKLLRSATELLVSQLRGAVGRALDDIGEAYALIWHRRIVIRAQSSGYKVRFVKSPPEEVSWAGIVVPFFGGVAAGIDPDEDQVQARPQDIGQNFQFIGHGLQDFD